ncbi:MAG: hypothetical protein GY719_31520 [bacterium]|nr:hypothetical protein [bacterium]
MGRLPDSGPGRVAGLVLMACHDNGYVRQCAVEGLATIATAESLGVLTMRLDDWVGVVRQRAFDAWSGLLLPEHVDVVVEALPLIWRIQTHQRIDGDHLWKPLCDLLSTPEGHSALLAGLAGNRMTVGRAALRAILKLDHRPDGWLSLALRSADASIQFQAARALVARADPDALARHLDTLFEARLSRNRHLALDVCASFFPDRLEEFWRKGLLDRSPGLRRRCQEGLVLQMDIDPVPLYRACLEEDLRASQRASALLGLAETSDVHDRPIFEAFVEAPTMRVRAAAVVGLGRLAQDGDAVVFLDFLRDPSARVVRAAESVLPRLPWTSRQLAEAFGKTESAAGRLAMVRLAFRLSAWDRTLFLMDALGDPDPRVRASASGALQHVVFNPRGWGAGRPTPEQRRDLEARLRSRARSLGQGVEQRLRFLLRTTGS